MVFGTNNDLILWLIDWTQVFRFLMKNKQVSLTIFASLKKVNVSKANKIDNLKLIFLLNLIDQSWTDSDDKKQTEHSRSRKQYAKSSS